MVSKSEMVIKLIILSGIPSMEVIRQIKSNCSVVNGTIDREACPKYWFVARVQVKCEKIVAKKIFSLGYETFVPVQEEIRQWSDRKKKIEKVLIPLMVFFKSDVQSAKKIEKLSFVHSLLKAPGEKYPAIIPDKQIEDFKFMLANCDDEVTISPTTLIIGDSVKVIRGSLRGLVGTIVKEPDGKERIVISIDFLGSASVKISRKDIENQS